MGMTEERTYKALEQTAQRLATLELQARMQDSQNLQSQLLALKNEAQSLRLRLPEFREKEVWWDVPFETGVPTQAETDTFHMADGFYLEGDVLQSFWEDGQTVLRGTRRERAITDLLNCYTAFSDSYILLHMDRKKMRKMIRYPAQVRTLYHAQWIQSRREMTAPIHDFGYVDFLRSSYQQDITRMDAVLQERLAESKTRWDKHEIFFNTLLHESAMTSEEAYMAGRISSQDYFDDSVWRNYDEADIRQRAMEEKRRRQLEYEEMLRRNHQFQVENQQYTVTTQEHRLHLMPVGEAVYGQGELLVLVVYKTAEPVYEIRCASDFQLEELSGKIYHIDKLFEKRVATFPLFQYLLQAYGNMLPLYEVLMPRPRNCPDAEWRMWAESRWAHTLGILHKAVI